MRISPISYNILSFNRVIPKSTNRDQYSPKVSVYDSVSFTSIGHGGALLKKLSMFGVPDMYTGRMMLDSKILENWQKGDLFSQPIKTVIKHTKRYKKTLGNVETEVYSILEKEAKKTPHDTLETVFKRLKPEYEKDLLSKQQPIFEELIQTACKMPKDRFNEFMKLMAITSRKIEKDPVILPFSEREFRYKLTRIAREIESKNDREEIAEINKLKRMSTYLFPSRKPTSRFVVKNTKLKKYVRNQRSSQAIKKNAAKLNQIYNYFQKSSLKDNKALSELFQDTRARIYGFPTIVPFKRKPFIHDLEKITATLSDKSLARKMQQIAVKLPRAKDDVSACFVKTSADTNNKIGFNIFSESVCSVDHLKPAKSGGACCLGNYGLCAKGTNSEKSNMSFAVWVEKCPDAKVNIQKYTNRMIALYKNGVFKHLGLKRSYIEDFANTIRQLTQNNKKPLIIDLRKLYDLYF